MKGMAGRLPSASHGPKGDRICDGTHPEASRTIAGVGRSLRTPLGDCTMLVQWAQRRG